MERILIRAANWVGDAIMTTPTIRAIRRNFPSAHITLLAKPWVAPVFNHNPDIDEVMIYKAAGRHGGWKGLLRLAKEMRGCRFDLAILFQNAFEAALLSFLAGIPRRMGFTTDGRTALLTERIRTWRPLKRGHLIDYYLGLLSGAGMALHGRQLTLVITPDEQLEARRYLAEMGMTEQLLVGLNPGATFGTAKRWLPDRFAQLGRRLIAEHKAQVVIFGGPDEADLGRWLAADIGPGAIDLCGQTTLRQAMALIGQCGLFVTNDSGLMHVAAALEIPQVAIIGPTDPVATGPVNASSRLVYLPEACEFSPCLQPHCPILDHRCMTSIPVVLVMQTALALLAQSKGR
ncbi:MAG: lipopolysaccharide heptosyltransferase II [Desulfobacterales bacterium]|nr:lipopolysaccharide heptosyltransferase II [Desulfobacterales bacterium]